MGSDGETITVSFIANYEVDPTEVEPVEGDSEFRGELRGGVVPGSGRVQEVVGVDEESLDRLRWRVKNPSGGCDDEHE